MVNAEIQTPPNNRPSAVVDMRPDTLVRIALLGLGTGAIAWALAMGLDKFIIGPVFCPTTGVVHSCASYSDVIAGNIVLILSGLGAMVGLVRLGAYRPMLVAIAVVATLWNLNAWLSAVLWYEALGWSALIYMVAYVAYAWLVRPRNFIVVVAMLAVFIGLVRYISTL